MRTSVGLSCRLSSWLGDYMSRPFAGFAPPVAYSAAQLGSVLQPGDVLLVEGNLRINSLIKYITRSMWSHLALYVGTHPGARVDDPPVLVEAELGEGVILSPPSRYVWFHTRICRAVGLRPDDRERLVSHAIGRLGHGYDFQNVIDLARDRLSRPSVAATQKFGLRALGSGTSTTAICSTLIAQAFQSVRYPILPARRETPCADTSSAEDCTEEAREARHYSTCASRDFDVSPYFTVVKPPPMESFDCTQARWAK